jgi:hypothetical protein
MSNPTTSAALHDLRAAQALIERVLRTLGRSKTAATGESVHTHLERAIAALSGTPAEPPKPAAPAAPRKKVPPLLGSNRNPEPEPTDGEEQSAA